jgi:hypothetical protein
MDLLRGTSRTNCSTQTKWSSFLIHIVGSILPFVPNLVGLELAIPSPNQI